jgi:5-amino-6-(5-phosphoribosylamino)uracil reductase
MVMDGDANAGGRGDGPEVATPPTPSAATLSAAPSSAAPSSAEKLPRLRLVLAVSLDGRLAPPTGGAAQLGGAGDRRVLEEALAWADGCLIGAETLRRHGSTCLIHQPDLLASRQARGLPPQPVAVVVSGSGRWRQDLPFFDQPLSRWWLQGSAIGGSARGAAAGFDRCIPLATWPEAIAELGRCGLRQLVLLGGARLAQELLTAGVVDELQLTLVPRLLGGPHTWLPADSGAMPGPSWRLLEQRPLGDGELLLRFEHGPG